MAYRLKLTGCMVGYPAVAVLADLACKGLADSANIATWAEAGAASSVYRQDLADKFKGHTRARPYHYASLLQGEIWLRAR